MATEDTTRYNPRIFIRDWIPGRRFGRLHASSSMAGSLLVYSSAALSGTLAAQSVLAGDIGVDRGIGGAMAGISDLQGGLSKASPLSGALAASSSMAAALNVTKDVVLGGQLIAQAAMAGDMAAARVIAGAMDSVSTASGAIAAARGLAGPVASAATMAALASLQRGLAGQMAGQSAMSGALTVPWTPLRLGSKLRAWFDFSDLSTLYRTTDTSTPVTADGQTVGRVEDKSGNGRHFTQATASARPTYHTAGGLHYLQPDGGDYMAGPTGLFDVTADAALGFSMSLEAVGSYPYVLGTDGLDTGFEFLFYQNTRLPRAYVVTTSGAISGNAAAAVTLSAKHTFIEEYDRSAGVVTVDKDGTQIINASGTAANLQTPATAYWLFGAAGAGGEISAKVYQMVMVSGGLTTGEKSSLKTFLDGKAGL